MLNETLKQAANFIYSSISDTINNAIDGRALFDHHHYSNTRQDDHGRRKRKRSSRGDASVATDNNWVTDSPRNSDEASSSESETVSSSDSIRPAEVQRLSSSSNSSCATAGSEVAFDGSENEYESAGESEVDDNDNAQQPPHRQRKQQRARRGSLGAATDTTENAISSEDEGIIFPVGTLVRKHFPCHGWYDGSVTDVRWSSSLKQWTYAVEYEGDDEGDDGEKQHAEVIQLSKLKDIVLPRGRYVDSTVCPFDEFLSMWEKLDPEAIEKSSAVRRANSRISNQDSGTQHTAQYGRILPRATDILFHVLRLKRSDVFLDIGHGVGNTCLQASYCTGCESRGIEIIKDRYDVSLDFANQIGELAREQLNNNENNRTRVPGEVILRRGDLSDGALHNWLARANKVFVNNFGGVFAERCVNHGSKWHLDHYIAGLFASMEEETIMITLSDLQMGPTRKDVNKWRIANKMETSLNASFFDVVKVELGEASDVFSWSQSSTAPAFAYVYLRVKQDPNLRTASITCCNRDCEHSHAGTPIPAVTYNKEGKVVVGACSCKRTSVRSRRDIPVVNFLEFLDVNGEYRDWGR